MVKNLPANREDMDGFHPWSGEIPQAAKQLSPSTTTAEPVLQSPEVAITELTCFNYGSP